MNPVTAEEYIKIYQLTGLDIDGRRESVEHMSPHIQNGALRSIGFVEALPGFTGLPTDDKKTLIKGNCNRFSDIAFIVTPTAFLSVLHL